MIHERVDVIPRHYRGVPEVHAPRILSAVYGVVVTVAGGAEVHRIAGTPDRVVGDVAKAGPVLDRLMGGTVFTQTYGQPVRLGKYHPGATEQEKATLMRAISNIAGDMAAMIPESMIIEFIEAANVGAAHALYKERSDWLDQQVSKAVLGQTSTTDAVIGGLGSGREHRQVQEDIERSDAKAAGAFLTRDLARPFVMLNHGPQAAYPRIRIGRPEQEDLKAFADAVGPMIDRGLEVDQEDIREKFPFERLFSLITDGCVVERKNKDEIFIPFNESPKIVLSTNFSITGVDDSTIDRQFIIEFSDYYNKSHRPVDDFGNPFFSGWNESEWSDFDNFMIGCLQIYLNKGLIAYEYINLEKKKLIDETCPEFVEFAESLTQTLSKREGFSREFEKKELYENFKKEYEEFDKLTQSKFTRWLKVWGRVKNYETVEEKSGSKRTIKYIARENN